MTINQDSHPIVRKWKCTVERPDGTSFDVKLRQAIRAEGKKMETESVEETIRDVRVDKAGGNVLKFMIHQYGGISSFVTYITRGLNYFELLRTNVYVTYATKALTVSMVAYDLNNKYNAYKASNVADMTQRKVTTIRRIMGMRDHDYYYCNSDIDAVGPEIIKWFMAASDHGIKDLVIAGHYDLNTGKVLDLGHENTEFGVLIQYKKLVSLIVVGRPGSQFGGGSGSTCHLKELNAPNSNHSCVIVDLLNMAYLDSMGWENNVLMYDYTIKKRPRSTSVDFDIKHIDYDKLLEDIASVLVNGRKRGFLLVGNPGTGKSSILMKLEDDLRAYPIMYVNAANLNDELNIHRLSDFIHSLRGCVVFLEDLDTMEISDKSKKIGPLLQLFDNSRAESSVVFVATINNAELINPAIVRTGRFDAIIEVPEPVTNEEIYDVLRQRWNSFQEDESKMVPEGSKYLKKLTYMRLRLHTFTQSDLVEIVQKLILDSMDFNSKNIIKCMKSVIKSKQTFSKYKHTEDDDDLW